MYARGVKRDAANLNQLADLHRAVAFEVQHAPQQDVGTIAHRARRRGKGRFERNAHERTGIKRAVVVGIYRQNQTMCEREGSGRHVMNV